MAIVNRISRLLQADLHAVLDSIEEPHALLKQAVREMEEELVRLEQRVKSLFNECELMVQRETDLQQSLEQIDDELNLCFESGNDDLARSLVRRKLELQKILKSSKRKREATQKQFGEAKSQLEENRTRFESMKQKAEILEEEYAAGQVGDGGGVSCLMPELDISDDEVEVALLREKKLRGRSPKELSS